MFSFSLLEVNAQGSMHPRVQQEVDALNLWLQKQMAEGNPIDQEELQRRNEKIKQIQAELESEREEIEAVDAADGTKIRRSGFPGNSFRVPEGKQWHVQAAFLKSLDQPYRIKVADYTFNSVYDEGEELRLPSWVSEFSLMDGGISSLNFQLEILEVDK